MSNLSEILGPNNIAIKIDNIYEENYIPRKRLGLSQAGHECDRFLWYKYNGYIELAPEGRILRLFELGNKIEDLVVADLRQAGYNVTDDQKEVVFEWDNIKLTGHIDGLIEGITNKTHLLEIKSACLKQFNILKKQGYENWHDIYKFQVHAYMLGLKLTRCLAVVYCKDNSDLYTERINLNKNWIIGRLEHVFNVISKQTIPERKCPNKSWYKAKWCNFYKECFK